MQRFLPQEKLFNSWLTCALGTGILSLSLCSLCGAGSADLSVMNLVVRGQGGLGGFVSLLRVALNTENVPASAT